jgi:hypothetical protein
MALTPGTIGRDNEGTGQDFLILVDGSSRRIQPFAAVDESGAHSGISTNPFLVSVISTVAATQSGTWTVTQAGTVTVEEASETFVRYSTPEAGEDSHANFGSGPCELRQLRCLLEPSVEVVRYLLYFDSLTVPADGTDPIWRTVVPANGAASEDFAKGEMALSTGLSVALSSTIDDLTKTVAFEAFLQVVVAT